MYIQQAEAFFCLFASFIPVGNKHTLKILALKKKIHTGVFWLYIFFCKFLIHGQVSKNMFKIK